MNPSYLTAALILIFSLLGLRGTGGLVRACVLFGSVIGIGGFLLIGSGLISNDNAVILTALFVGGLAFFFAGFTELRRGFGTR